MRNVNLLIRFLVRRPKFAPSSARHILERCKPAPHQPEQPHRPSLRPCIALAWQTINPVVHLRDGTVGIGLSEKDHQQRAKVFDRGNSPRGPIAARAAPV